MKRVRRINPLDIALAQRTIVDHPGDEPWCPKDLALWSGVQLVIDQRDGIPTANHPISADKLDKILTHMGQEQVQKLVDEGRLAAPEKKTAKSRDPAFMALVPGVSRVADGKAAAAISAARMERANMIADPVARKNAVSAVGREVDVLRSTPNERYRSLALMFEQTDVSHEMWAGDRARASKLETQVNTLLEAQAQLLRIGGWKFDADEEAHPSPQPRKH